MPRQPTQAELFNELLARYEREIADVFRAAVADLGRQADLGRVIEALARNDIEAALEALHIDEAAFNDLQNVVGRAYAEGGSTAAEIANRQTPKGVVIRFNGRNYRAEQWLREHSAQLVTRIVEDQRQAVRNALTAGMEKGVNPRTSALDIVGRVNRVTGARDGGVLGLTTQQEAFARSARDELRSGDPAQLHHYLTRTRRDKRFDRSVLKAIREEQPLPADITAKAEVRYKDRLLQLRGQLIAQVESFDALAAAKHEAFVQASETGGVDPALVTKDWRHFANLDPRPDHIAMNRKKVGLHELFILPDGTAMRFAHDPAAPIKHKAGCHCQTEYSIRFVEGLR